MSKKKSKIYKTQNIKEKSSKLYCGTVGGIESQIHSSGKLGRHCDIVKSGCGIIDNKAKAQKKEDRKMKNYIKSLLN